MSAAGAAMFARFAFPPNLLGYCGPADAEELFAYGAGLQAPDAGLEELARAFDGAWPYLELLNGAAPFDDALDERVVEAYWIGNDLLTAVDSHAWGDHLLERFRPGAGSDLDRITAGVGAGAGPNHAYHVFGVYPWVGLLREGRGGSEPLWVMDRCRIRWGEVIDVAGDRATVRSRPLTWSGDTLTLGDPMVETAQRGDGRGLAGSVAPGDTVALHWNWICQRLSRGQVCRLEQVTRSQIAASMRP